MLVEISIANYRSFFRRQTLSMVAARSSERNPAFSFKTRRKNAPHLLRVAAIFGPNGSGKTTLVRALDFIDDFVRGSAKEKQKDEAIDVVPFKLSDETQSKPSEFEIVFIEHGNQYQYGFAVDRKRVWEEWLFCLPKNSNRKTPRRWFHRSFNRRTKSYDWYINPILKGKKETWRDATRDNALFLSTAVQLNAKVFQEAFDWIQTRLRTVPASARLSPVFTGALCLKTKRKEKILNFLRAAGLEIVDIRVDRKKISEEDLRVPNDMPAAIQQELFKRLKGQKYLELFLGHRRNDGKTVYLNVNEESEGTKVLFALAGPWLDVLEHGYVVVVDELGNSLHPLVLEMLVRMFHDKQLNRSNAQLLFTGHETHIMSGKMLHRDEIYLVEKNKLQATEIVPLSDFKPRTNEAFERGYLGGRYGAIPNVSVARVGR